MSKAANKNSGIKPQDDTKSDMYDKLILYSIQIKTTIQGLCMENYYKY